MGMPQKGSRRITVEQDLYLWRVMRVEAPRAYGGRSPGLCFLLAVQRAVDGFEKPGSVAFFHLESRKKWFRMLPWGGSDDTPGTNICNEDVRELVTYALKNGWNPMNRGPAFHVGGEEEGPDLTGFSLRSVA